MSLKTRAILQLERANATHTDVFQFILAAKSTESLSLEDQADMLGFIKQIHNLFDDLKKQLYTLAEQYTGKLCNDHLIQSLSDMEDAKPSVRGEFFLATPSMKTTANVPPRDSIEYLELMRFVMQQHTTAESLVDSDLLRVHWPAFTQLVTNTVAAGHPLPPGVSSELTKPMPSCAVRGVSRDS